MYSFTNDYSEGAHPKIMTALLKTNLEQTDGYGLDKYCLQATELLKKQLKNENVDVHYLVGGTQTNATFIASALKPYQAVIAADSGHINVHETGAVEATGHKILTAPHQNGKITPEEIEMIVKQHPDEHMVQPKMVYLSQSSEYGSVYYLDELQAISELCKEYNLYLFVDGARLGSALAVANTPSLADLAKYTDAFYIGGTKMGALFGECLVIVNDQLKPDFRYNMKQNGAMLAKGRLLGVQFKELFSNDLYLQIGQYENKMADILRAGLKKFKMYVDSPTNQIFPIVNDELIAKLQEDFSFNVMDKIDENHHCIRLVTSWATPQKAVEEFVTKINQEFVE
ncbi:low specificity L-threonine aldolase [uncultured Thomasclavelia sp.]|uniref:threonine aldolase family protein n=1 Tax=uncultured Thomasclavelia sp. TaxID=3025759 RepID=UPI0025DCAD7B|nr:aminotransferase class I/II-fold pyridoxal phosphate-dependent enzyme [uncultured Thomasclavelia sp.]